MVKTIFSNSLRPCAIIFGIIDMLTTHPIGFLFVSQVRNTDIAKELCLPPVKLHCSMLAEDAIKAALNDYKVKRASATGSTSAKKATVV